MPRRDMDSQPATPKAARIISLALIAGMVFFAVVVVGLIESGSFEASTTDDDDVFTTWLPLAGPILLLLTAPVGFMLRSQMLKKADEMEDPAKAAQPYLAGSILFMAMLEGPALLGIVTTLVTGSYFPNMLAPVMAIALGIANLPGERHFASRRELRGI